MEMMVIEEIKSILEDYAKEVMEAECANDAAKAKDYAFNRICEAMQAFQE